MIQSHHAPLAHEIRRGLLPDISAQEGQGLTVVWCAKLSGPQLYEADEKVDLILFYHSSSKPTGVYGIAVVHKKAHTDHSALDPKDEHFDPKSTKEKPIWECVDVKYLSTFANPVTLETLKKTEKLGDMAIFHKGSRLSVTSVTKRQFDLISKMGR